MGLGSPWFKVEREMLADNVSTGEALMATSMPYWSGVDTLLAKLAADNDGQQGVGFPVDNTLTTMPHRSQPGTVVDNALTVGAVVDDPVMEVVQLDADRGNGRRDSRKGPW